MELSFHEFPASISLISKFEKDGKHTNTHIPYFSSVTTSSFEQPVISTTYTPQSESD